MKNNVHEFTAYDVNQVIQISSSQQQHSQYKCIIVPAYLRIKVKGINELNVGLLTGNIKLLIILVVYYGDNSLRLNINEDIVLDLSKVDRQEMFKRGSKIYKQTIQKSVLGNYNLNNPETIILRHDSVEKTLNYLINIEVKVKIQPKVLFTPLEYINTKFKVTLNNFYFKQKIQTMQKPKGQFTLRPQKVRKSSDDMIQSEYIIQDSQDSKSKDRYQNPQGEAKSILDSIRSKYSNFKFHVQRKESINKSLKMTYQVVHVKFNFMNCHQKYLKIYFEDGITLGDYDLAEKNLDILYQSNIKDRNSFCFYYDLQTNRRLKQKQKALQAISSFWKRSQKKEPIELFDFNIHVFSILQRTISFNQHAIKLAQNNYQEQAQRLIKDNILVEKAFLSQLQIQNIDKNYEKMGKEELVMTLIQSLQSFNVATIYVPFYRQPIAMMITLLIPFLMLGLINLGVFFQSNDISSRMACIATLLVAFNAFLPAFRQQLPSVPKVTLVQILIILEVLTCLLCGIQSISVRNIRNYKFDWQTDNYYLLSLFITITNLLVIIIMAMLHFCYFRIKYNDVEDNKHSRPFLRHKWHNQNLAKTLNELKIIKDHIKIEFDKPRNSIENSTMSYGNTSKDWKKEKKSLKKVNTNIMIWTIKIVTFGIFLVFCFFCYVRIFVPKSFMKRMIS